MQMCHKEKEKAGCVVVMVSIDKACYWLPKISLDHRRISPVLAASLLQGLSF
jgi:hypothetical protein